MKMNAEVNKNDWTNFFESMSKRRFDWSTSIEVLDPEMGDQVLSHGLPLNGLTMETVGDEITLDISVGGKKNRHQTHNIVNPSRIAYLQGDESHGEVIDIEESNGTKTLITLIGPMDLLRGFSAREMARIVG
jgi:hypothetical protein